MTVYGGPRPTPPRPKLDPVLLTAFGFLVVAVIAGIVFAVQGSGGGGHVSRAEQATAAPAQPVQQSPTATSAAPSPSPSPTQGAIPTGPAALRAGHSQLCLQANEGNGGNATQVPCDRNPTQLWVPHAAGPDTYTFVNAKDNRCLDVNGGSRDNGAQVLQWDCHGGPNQQWQLRRDGDGYNIVSVNSGKCIGIDSGNPAAGTPARQWDCDGSANQRWQFA